MSQKDPNSLVKELALTLLYGVESFSLITCPRAYVHQDELPELPTNFVPPLIFAELPADCRALYPLIY